MRNFLFRVWMWLKVRFQGELKTSQFGESLSRNERRYLNRYQDKYSGLRTYTKAPAIR